MKCGPMTGSSPAIQQKCFRSLNVISCTERIMHSSSIHRPAGHWPKTNAAGTLTLHFDARHRRPIRLPADEAEDILLDLPKALALAHGEVLTLEDGRGLCVQAAPKPIPQTTHPTPHP